MADLLWNVGEVRHFWRSVAADEVKDPERDYTDPERPTDSELPRWYRDGLTDTDHAWTVDHTGEHWRVRHEPHRSDCAVSGTASDLLLALWRRTGTETLTVTGDAEALDTLITAAETE